MMNSTDLKLHLHQEHRELLVLARTLVPPDTITPAEAESFRQRLAKLGERLASHLESEASTIHGLCSRGGGALSIACATRQREADGLSESINGMVRRWGKPGAIERDPSAFRSTWEVLLASLQRLQSREEGDIYPSSGTWKSTPIVAPKTTGLPGLARDHEHLFDLIGGLRAAITDGQIEIDARLVAELASYTERHMADEEAIMEATGFPGIEDHRAEHHQARTILLGFRNDHSDGRHVQAISVLEFLERWLASHIATVDHAMAEYALEAGWKP